MSWLEEAKRVYANLEAFEKDKKSKLLIDAPDDIPHQFDGIRSISFMSSLKGVSVEDTLPKIISEAPELEQIHIFSSEITWEYVCSLDLSHITELTFSLKGEPSDDRIEAPNMKALIITGTSHLTPMELMLQTRPHMDFSGLKSLENLKLMHLQQVDPADFQNVSTLKRLFILNADIYDLDWLKYAAYELNMLNINSSIESCDGLIFQPLLRSLVLNGENIKDISPIYKLKHLELLNLSYRDGMDEGKLRDLKIPRMILTRRDHDIYQIDLEVLELVRFAVNQYRSLEITSKKQNISRFLRIVYENKLKKPFEDVIEEYIQSAFDRKLEKINEIRRYKTISQEEHKRIFIERALAHYPFLKVNND